MNTPDIDIRPKLHPLLADLPDFLKDPANYEKIEADILKTFLSSCGHSDIMQWAECEKCSKKMLERRHLLKSLGFKNPAQYRAWKMVHQKIKERMPLVDWKKNKLIK